MMKTTNTMRFMTVVVLLSCLAAVSAEAQGRSTEGDSDPRMRDLQQAAFDGDMGAVKRLVAAGVSADATDPDGHTALMWAAFNGHTSVAGYLLEQGAILEAKDKLGRTALMYASSGPNDETVKLLLTKGAFPNRHDKEERFTALMFAAAEGQMKIVGLLLEHGADPQAKDADGDTAHSMAAKNGHAGVVEVLTKGKVPVGP